jgi:uncharacterized protein (DUF1330 family)
VLVARWPGPAPDGVAGAAARVAATFTGRGAEAAVPEWVPPQEHNARFPRAAHDLIGVDVHDVPAPQRGAGLGQRAGPRASAAPEGLRVHRGPWPEQRRTVGHRWPSGAAFRASADSARYRPWLQLRRAGATGRHVVLEGLGG